MATDIKKLAEELVNMTVLEVNELKTVLKDEYGIEPAAAVAVASLQQAVEQGKVEKDSVIMLNITGGGIGRFKAENSYYQKKPDLVFAINTLSEEIQKLVAELF